MFFNFLNKEDLGLNVVGDGHYGLTKPFHCAATLASAAGIYQTGKAIISGARVLHTKLCGKAADGPPLNYVDLASDDSSGGIDQGPVKVEAKLVAGAIAGFDYMNRNNHASLAAFRDGCVAASLEALNAELNRKRARGVQDDRGDDQEAKRRRAAANGTAYFNLADQEAESPIPPRADIPFMVPRQRQYRPPSPPRHAAPSPPQTRAATTVDPVKVGQLLEVYKNDAVTHLNAVRRRLGNRHLNKQEISRTLGQIYKWHKTKNRQPNKDIAKAALANALALWIGQYDLLTNPAYKEEIINGSVAPQGDTYYYWKSGRTAAA